MDLSKIIKYVDTNNNTVVEDTIHNALKKPSGKIFQISTDIAIGINIAIMLLRKPSLINLRIEKDRICFFKISISEHNMNILKTIKQIYAQYAG